MKLFTKISLIVAAVAGGLGILGIVIGLAMGADIHDLSNMGIHLSPHQQVAVSSVITEDVEEKIVTKIEEADGIHDNNRHHREKLHDYTCSIPDIKHLEVEAQNAQITIFAVDSMEEFVYYSDKENLTAKVEDSTLKIEDHSSWQDKIKLELYIPVGVFKEIEIEAAAGSIVADRIIADSVTMEIDAASVQIEELQVTKEAELRVKAGEIVVGYYDGPRLDVDCSVGSITVVCEGNEFDYNYEMECGMGRIAFDKESYSLIGEKIRHNNSRSKMIEAKCEMGEIIIEFPNSL